MSDIDLVHVIDPVLDLHDKIKFMVLSGPMQNTFQPYNANSVSSGSATFNIILPSQDTVVNRRVLLRGSITLKVTGTPPAYTPLFQLGANSSFAPFPLHQAMSVFQTTLNNNSISFNVRDNLAVLLSMIDKRELSRYNGTTPTYIDNYRNYEDCVGAVNNPNGSYANSGDEDLLPRGSFVVDSILSAVQTAGNIVIGPNNIPYNTDGTTAVSAYVTFTSVEPLLMSPFIYGNPAVNCQGMMGLTNLTSVITNVDFSRCFRVAKYFNNNVATCAWADGSLTGYSVGNVAAFTPPPVYQMLLQQLSMHSSQMRFSRNILPYYSLDRYITSNIGSLPASTLGANGALVYSTKVFTASALQLNSIPDKIYIIVRDKLSNSTCATSDSFYPISQVNITWNNLSGVLNSASTYDLYRMSVDAGSKQSWQMFSGGAVVPDPLNGGQRFVPTVGSVVCLQFGKDIPLVNEFDAPSSIGAYNIVVQVTVANNTLVQQDNLEIQLSFQNPGAVILERGQCSVVQALLNKSSVLDCKQEDHQYNYNDVKRMVGGSFLDNLKVYANKGVHMLPHLARKGLEMVDNPYAKSAVDVMKNFGVGNGRSGGRLSKHLA